MNNTLITPVNMDGKEIFEKLNILEQQKLTKKPIDYINEIDTLNTNSLGNRDRDYLQNFGIYNNELNDDEFMLRLRFPAGRIANITFLSIAKIATDYNLDIILTARAGMQLQA